MAEYGILIYDVPQANESLYRRLYKRISKKAIRMNLSVYLLPWGMKSALMGLVDEAIRCTGQMATVNVLKFDSSDTEKIEAIAKQCLQKEIQDMVGRLKKKIDKALEDQKSFDERYFNVLKERMTDIQTLTVLFGFESDILSVIEEGRKLVREESSRYFSSRLESVAAKTS